MVPTAPKTIQFWRLCSGFFAALPIVILFWLSSADGVQANAQDRAEPGNAELPRARWNGQPGAAEWTAGAIAALKAHGAALIRMEPADIDVWCPAYRGAGAQGRRAFWVGFLSALAKHESTYRPTAVGGGGRWFGLLQISPGTARGYGCAARSGTALKNGSANLSCAIRIMAVTVPRDGVVYAPGGKGVAADWGPMRSSSKRKDMVAYTRALPACRPLDATRPNLRP